MFKKLKTRFILLSMVSLALLMITVVLGINIMNYYSVTREADMVVDMLSENKGRHPEEEFFGGFEKLPPNMSPEVPYESRYFTVEVNDHGDIFRIDTTHIAAVDEGLAREYTGEAMHKRAERGFIKHFRFLKVREPGGATRVIFLDSGRRIDSLLKFLLSSIIVAFLGYALICLVVVFVAGKIIRPVAESYEKQKRFITDAGHEIKTPLSIISANLDLMELEGHKSESLDEINKQTKRLARLTNDLVFLAKMEEKGESLCKTEFPLSEMVSEAATSFGALAESKHKKLDARIEPMIIMNGSESDIYQLINILLDNAIKYSPEQSVIYLSLEKKGKVALLRVVNDTVAPKSKDELPLLFDRFYRSDNSRSSKTGGHGIGLSIAKAVVESHGGRICASLVGDSTIRISAELPL